MNWLGIRIQEGIMGNILRSNTLVGIGIGYGIGRRRIGHSGEDFYGIPVANGNSIG